MTLPSRAPFFRRPARAGYTPIRRMVITAGALGVLAACGERTLIDTPEASKEDFLRASDVLVAAQCELNSAFSRPEATFGFRKAVMTLTLSVVQNEATGGGLTLTVPIAGSRISLERSRRPIGSAVRRMDVQLIHDVARELDCPSAETPRTATGVRHIAGGLGLREWLVETDEIVRRSGRAPSEVSYELSFDIAVTSSLNPVFSRTNEDGISPDVETETADDRRVKHRIVVTLLPDPEGRARPDDQELVEAARQFLGRL